ncbi:MAG: dTMP kinase [Treponema sp.]|jgi:dTMP kinase|nr:dTMP kinase [Treponema sp.]
MTGRFIVFEGIDGSGTTTQAMMLHGFLLSKSKKALITSEPSSGPVGCLIRLTHTKRISSTGDRHSRERYLSRLFAADRDDHLYNDENGILKQIESGYYVLSTRYYLSSFAYHVFEERDYEFVDQINKDFPPPDYTFYLDCSIECSLKRITSSRLPDINEEKTNLLRVKRNYEYAIPRYKGKISIINADRKPQDIHREIVSILQNAGLIQ